MQSWWRPVRAVPASSRGACGAKEFLLCGASVFRESSGSVFKESSRTFHETPVEEVRDRHWSRLRLLPVTVQGAAAAAKRSSPGWPGNGSRGRGSVDSGGRHMMGRTCPRAVRPVVCSSARWRSVAVRLGRRCTAGPAGRPTGGTVPPARGRGHAGAGRLRGRRRQKRGTRRET